MKKENRSERRQGGVSIGVSVAHPVVRWHCQMAGEEVKGMAVTAGHELLVFCSGMSSDGCVARGRRAVDRTRAREHSDVCLAHDIFLHAQGLAGEHDADLDGFEIDDGW